MYVLPAKSPGLGRNLPNRIICYGDVIDDIVVVPKGPIRPDTDTSALINARAGGSAANTAAWLGRIGVSVDLVAVVGYGDAARHRSMLPGVTAYFREHPTLQTGRVIVIVQHERRDMLTDRGANVTLTPNDVSPSLLMNARLLHLTGHTLLNTDGYAGVRTLIERCRAAGLMVSVSPGSAGFVQDYGVDQALKAFLGADILVAGLEEGRILSGAQDVNEALITLNKHFDVVAITQGSQGVSVVERGEVSTLDVDARPVVDPTGAGDAFSAGFLATLIETQNVRLAVQAGVELAARAVGELGGRPT